MPGIVMKFGGSSLKDPQRIRTVAAIVEKNMDREPLIVVSAHGKVTDLLIGAAKLALQGDIYGGFTKVEMTHREIMDGLDVDHGILAGNFRGLEELLRGISLVKELTPRTLDFVMSYGERMASKVVAAFLRQRGLPAEAINSYDLGFITDSNFGSARPLKDAPARIKEAVSHYEDSLIVTTGFIGKNTAGEVTTVGRNGSDYSAACIGAALDVKEIQRWTETDGVMTADPGIIPTAKTIPMMTFSEASEVAYYGGQIMHPSTMIPAMDKKIPIRVLNTYKPDNPGTVIVSDDETVPEGHVKSVVYKEDIYLVHITSTRMLMQPGFMAKLFEVLGRHKVVIGMIATSEVTVSLTTDNPEGLADAAEEIHQSDIGRVKIEPGKAIVCVVGKGMRHSIGIASAVFTSVANADVNIQMISQGAGEINISFLINNDEIERAVKEIHKEFFEKE